MFKKIQRCKAWTKNGFCKFKGRFDGYCGHHKKDRFVFNTIRKLVKVEVNK